MAPVEREEPASSSLDHEVLRPAHGPATRGILLAGAALFGLASLSCLAVSLWAHIVALTGNDPRLVWHSIWVMQPLLLLVIAPIGVIIMLRGVKRDPFGVTHFIWNLQLGLLVYYGIHFYLFFYRAQSVLRAAYTWQMFSAGWILLFALATAVYGSYVQRSFAE